MRILTLLLLTAATVSAQSPLTTTFANNNGGAAGGAVYFDLTGVAPVQILDIDLHFGSAAGTAGSIDVYEIVGGTYVGNEQNPAAWTLAASAPVTAGGIGVPTNCVLSAPLVVGAGVTNAYAIVANGLAHTYTTGTAPFPLTYSTVELSLTAGAAGNVPFTGVPFSPRIVNINVNYVAAGPGTVATVADEGTGCVQEFGSVYELFAAGTNDLANTAWTFQAIGGGAYVVLPAGTFNPVGTLSTPTAVALTDDSQAAVGTLGLTVGSNGWIALGAGNSNAFTPTVAAMLANPSTGFYSWHDMNPAAAGSGQVQYEEAGPLAVVTYDGVFNFGGTTAGTDDNFIQYQYNSVTGDVVLAFGNLSTGGNGWLVGTSPGGASLDPGGVDWSTGGPFFTSAGDVSPLSLTATSGRPVQGPAAAQVSCTTDNIPASAIIHVGWIGETFPGTSLGIVGLPNSCTLNVGLDIIVDAQVITGSSITWNALNLPALPPDFSGYTFGAQSAVFDLGIVNNNTRVSNGLQYVVGTL
jgi:hypothetical protein